MKDWERDKCWAGRFLPEIKQIIGLHLISEAPMEEDAQRNTDLIVLRLEAVRIGCRIRNNSYLGKYGGQITLRSERPNGTKTELAKIVEGWGDYFFYGFSDQDDRFLAKWVLGDLKAFRLYFNRKLWLREKTWVDKSNHDGSSSFMCFTYSDIPNFIVSESGVVKREPYFADDDVFVAGRQAGLPF